MFLREYPHALTEKFCNQVIEKFDQDDRKYPGMTASGIMPSVKSSLDLNISEVPGYDYEDQVFHRCLSHYSNRYLCEEFVRKSNLPLINLIDSGYQVQKTNPGEFYSWHNDAMVQYNSTYVRILTYIWYLNSVSEGGETEFITGEKVKPEKGKLLIFPATWNMIHQGRTPISNTKYIATGWMYSQIPPN